MKRSQAVPLNLRVKSVGTRCLEEAKQPPLAGLAIPLQVAASASASASLSSPCKAESAPSSPSQMSQTSGSKPKRTPLREVCVRDASEECDSGPGLDARKADDVIAVKSTSERDPPPPSKVTGRVHMAWSEKG